jgi:hypothetical protein
MRFVLVTIETDDSRRHSREYCADHRARIETRMSEQARRGTLVGARPSTPSSSSRPQSPGSRRQRDVTEGPFAGSTRPSAATCWLKWPTATRLSSWPRPGPPGETIEVRPTLVGSLTGPARSAAAAGLAAWQA